MDKFNVVIGGKDSSVERIIDNCTYDEYNLYRIDISIDVDGLKRVINDIDIFLLIFEYSDPSTLSDLSDLIKRIELVRNESCLDCKYVIGLISNTVIKESLQTEYKMKQEIYKFQKDFPSIKMIYTDLSYDKTDYVKVSLNAWSLYFGYETISTVKDNSHTCIIQ